MIISDMPFLFNKCSTSSVLFSLSSLTFSPILFLRAVQRQQGYASLQDEAVRVFNSLQEMETLADTVPIIQGILQTCQDLRPLRDEVLYFLQVSLIKRKQSQVYVITV